MKEVSTRAQLGTWVALLALAGASFGLSYAHMGSFSVPVALAIAAAKGTLVALFFMELVKERFSMPVTAIVAILLVVTLIAFAAGDVATRSAPPLLPPA